MQGNGSKIRQGNLRERVPRSVQTSHEGKVIALCNQQVPTDRTIPNNKLDITKRDNEMNMYVVISQDRNVIKKEAEKIKQFEDLITETAHVECKNKSDITNNRVTGTISKSSRQHLCNLSGKHDTKEIQKTAILGTVHLLWEVLT